MTIPRVKNASQFFDFASRMIDQKYSSPALKNNCPKYAEVIHEAVIKSTSRTSINIILPSASTTKFLLKKVHFKY